LARAQDYFFRLGFASFDLLTNGRVVSGQNKHSFSRGLLCFEIFGGTTWSESKRVEANDLTIPEPS
jgi:hypothetical protein